MEIIIKGDPKEIAALVVALQERRDDLVPQSLISDHGTPFDLGIAGGGIKLCTECLLKNQQFGRLDDKSQV